MARTISIGSRNYAAGTYGPYSVDSLLGTNPDWIEVTFTVENWPAAAPLMTGSLLWDSGDGTEFRVDTPLPPDRTGAARSSVSFRAYVPKTASGNVPVAGGDLNITVHAALRTAVSVLTG